MKTAFPLSFKSKAKLSAAENVSVPIKTISFPWLVNRQSKMAFLELFHILFETH
jgi:hypothetical protein